MSSSKDNDEDMAPSCSPLLPRQPEEGISESNFKMLLVEFADWYENRHHINMLKVLYRGHVPIDSKLIEATKVIDLLHMLIDSGNLCSRDLTILIDTIKVTKQFGFTSSLLPTPKNIRKCEVSSFSKDRQKLMKFGMELTGKNIETLDGLYNIPLLKYSDSWSLILDLVQRMVLCEGNLDNFIEPLGLTNEAAQPILKRPRLESQDDIIRQYLLTHQQNLCSNASRFTPAIMRNRYQVDIAHMFTDLKLMRENLNQKDGISTTLEEVLWIVKSSPACKVLIEGVAGIGKSTLLRYVAYKWAANKSDETFKGKIVFLVNIRDIDRGKTIVDTIVKQIDLEELFVNLDLQEDPKLVKRFIMNHDDEVVLLLDGLDELVNDSESPITYFKKSKMKNSKVLLTSRREQINEFIKHSTVHVKVEGFSNDNIEKYIKKHFDYMEIPALADALVRALKIGSDVYSICKNPMLLLAICNMWEDKQCLPNNKADLCKEMFRCILNQFNKQTSKSKKISRFEDIPENFVKAMLVLGKCMYEGLKVNQLYLNRKNLEGNKAIVDLALNLGFVYEEVPSSKANFEIIFTAPHKFIVESLVAFYLYKICLAEGLENESVDGMNNVLKSLHEKEWEVIRKSTHLILTRDLTIQFLGANAAKFLNHWITNDWLTYHMLIQYLYSMPTKTQGICREGTY